MKYLIVAAFTLCACVVAYGQQKESKKTETIQNTEEIAPLTVATPASSIPEPLYVLSEGGLTRELSIADIEKLNITQIASIEVITDEESIREYGEKGKNGVLIISLKKIEAAN